MKHLPAIVTGIIACAAFALIAWLWQDFLLPAFGEHTVETIFLCIGMLMLGGSVGWLICSSGIIERSFIDKRKQRAGDKRVINIISNSVKVPEPEIGHGIVSSEGRHKVYNLPDKTEGKVIATVVFNVPLRVFEINSTWIRTEHGWMERYLLRIRLEPIETLKNPSGAIEHMQSRISELLEKEE